MFFKASLFLQICKTESITSTTMKLWVLSNIMRCKNVRCETEVEWNGVCVISFFWVTDLFCSTKSNQSQERLCCEWHDHQMSYMYTKHFTASIRKGREREFGRKTAREDEERKRWSAFRASHARGRRNPLSKLNTSHVGYLAITTTQGWVANQQWLLRHQETHWNNPLVLSLFSYWECHR